MQEYDYSRQILSTEAILERRERPLLVTPVVEAVDMDVKPLDAYLRLKRPGAYSFLFESADLGCKSARFSFVGSSRQAIAIKDGLIMVNGKPFTYEGGPVALLKDLMAGFKPSEPVFIGDEVPLPVFYGGLAGYISYDFVRYIYNIGDKALDDLGCMDAGLAFVDSLAVFDHASKRLLLISNCLSRGRPGLNGARARLAGMKAALARGYTATPPTAKAKRLDVKYSVTKERFVEMVKRAKEYILDGDAFQIVLSQRAEVEADVDPVALYQALKEINPSPYMYFLEYGDTGIVGSSPEILVKVEDRKITVRPIAGTRRRGKDAEEDAELEKEMKSDPKELAEHVMLVDLGRNDVGKVSKFGSVSVDDYMAVEKYSHVQHIVSNVVGELRDDKDAIDVLAATFPAGTVSGAPKTRAMQIIEELEGRRRGLYAGCVGYFCFNSNSDLAIAIRTVLLKNGKAYVQAGAGIVMDSVPENEYVESLNKGAAMLSAIGRSLRGG
ncbi:anthranilate synthase component I [Methanocella conradii HZ254]|uniref:anthranilate synthase n=1 Tax=Methanocella conradii (strain DSM 24694 / JCM 17849 / CGMCC 1.5162 / HZ254) TaxID=1041930 RepID=H8IA78_METCZ|nr:anthranilate synthase component I [Methanocella conradii]AFC99144.1 anthranilate synthase component I [Methanocella conradii HZ254]